MNNAKPHTISLSPMKRSQRERNLLNDVHQKAHGQGSRVANNGLKRISGDPIHHQIRCTLMFSRCER